MNNETFDCTTKTIDIGYSSPLKIEECEDRELEIWKNISSSKIIYKIDTLDLFKLYKLNFEEIPQNLHFIDLEKENTKIFASYYFRGCVGDFCKLILKIEFEINKKSELIVSDIYHFNEETQEKEKEN